MLSQPQKVKFNSTDANILTLLSGLFVGQNGEFGIMIGHTLIMIGWHYDYGQLLAKGHLCFYFSISIWGQ